MNSSARILQLVLVLVLQLLACRAEFYSSTSGLEQLFRTEIVLLDELQSYVDEITQHAEALQSEIDAIRVEHLSAMDSIGSYLNNPVNAFRLIKRLHSDWETFESSVKGDTSRADYLEAMAELRENLSYPSQDDFVGSAIALTRLQQTYQLDVAELASGMLNGVKYGTAMSWQDCFVLGQHLYALRDYNHTVPWLQQSMQLLGEQSYGEESASLDFMEAVVGYHQQMGDHENALNLVNHVLAIEPEQRRHLEETRTQLEDLITDGVKQGLLHTTARRPGDYHSSREFRMYEQVCRGELAPSPAAQRHLRCRLQTSRFGYAPFKLEELHADPPVVQLHDMVSQRESLFLQNAARPRIQRSTVYNQASSGATAAAFRTSQGATFNYSRYRTTQRLSQHVADLSGLDMDYAENLQIANYGIGGHYEPHWDSFPEHHVYPEDDRHGNRLATAIYYLSDVEAGGGTAFPFLPLLVTPERGSLLFWYNLHPSGDQDYRTKHAACPVLQGSKWIANVWIRERNQDRVRPCDLQRNHLISLQFKNFD
ncbi:prolyl 4-hydroxylase subunit alpha-1 [Drosophila subobscura]|uniref:prolyl 4-hydroxylase subunit alpha-1 n=1 Tax=Drosophila subobscura TaxID=7241 RepID=UPI00155AEED9|nr:prolyl 4-hydroxylase subunit alpha-1 [Drosophila subobscura]